MSRLVPGTILYSRAANDGTAVVGRFRVKVAFDWFAEFDIHRKGRMGSDITLEKVMEDLRYINCLIKKGLIECAYAKEPK